MSKKLIPLLAIIPLLFVAHSVRAQESPEEVSACNLAKDPKSYDGKTIRVRATLSVEFEDFTLAIKRECGTPQAIWLAFGGDVPGIVASMTNDNVRKLGTDIKVNGVSYGIMKDENFRRLYALIAARHGDKPAYQVTATLTGAFLAGEERKLPDGKSDFGGYGHIGCCSLFVITQVADVKSVPSARLDVRGTLLGPDGKPIKGFEVIDDILGGSPPERQQMVTNGQGQFNFSISGQLVRFENPMYRPVALAVEPGGAHVLVRLENSKSSDWFIPQCGAEMNPADRIGFSVLFPIPSTMESSPSNTDNSHTYFIFPRGEEPTSAEFFVSTSTDQTAETTDAVGSDWSEQRWIKESTGTVIGIDARGRQKNGVHWRRATFWGHDTAFYNVRLEGHTKFLDGVINSACIAKR